MVIVAHEGSIRVVLVITVPWVDAIVFDLETVTVEVFIEVGAGFVVVVDGVDVDFKTSVTVLLDVVVLDGTF